MQSVSWEPGQGFGIIRVFQSGFCGMGKTFQKGKGAREIRKRTGLKNGATPDAVNKKVIPAVWIFLFVIFLISVAFGYYCVWTHDDFCTITDSVKAMLTDSLFYGNGRYLGNFIVNICLSHKPLDALVRGVIITGIIALTASVFAEFDIKTLSLSFALFYGFGNFIFREAVIWGHGFYNYVPPIFLCLICLQIIKSYYVYEKTGCKKLITALIAILAICQQLFSENASCVIMLIAIIVFAAVLRSGKSKSMVLAYLIGTSVGTFIMFALPAITKVSYKMVGYRRTGMGESAAGFISLFGDNLELSLKTLLPMIPLWIAASFGLMVLARAYSGSSKILKKLKPLFITVFILQPVCSVVYFFISEKHVKDRIPFTSIHVPDMDTKIRIFLFAVFCIFLIFAAFFLMRNEKLRGERRGYGVLIFIFAVSVGELLIVYPMGSRCLFLPACILAALVVRLFYCEDLLKTIPAIAAAVCGLVISVTLVVMMHSVSVVHEAKMAYARQQLAEHKEVIEIIRLPHSRWLMVPDETYAHGWYFNYGENKPLEDYTYITYEDYLERQGSYK